MIHGHDTIVLSDYTVDDAIIVLRFEDHADYEATKVILDKIAKLSNIDIDCYDKGTVQ